MLKKKQRPGQVSGGITRTFGVAAALTVSTMALAPMARAQSLQSALNQTTVSGMVGALNFDYLNHGHTPYDNHAFAVGGHLVVHTGSFHGFSVGLGGYTAQSLGLYNNLRGSTELTGQYHSIQTFRQAYLQYQTDAVAVRFGRQLINSPYAGEDYYTFNPRAFMGVAGVVNVIGGKSEGVNAGPLQLTGSTAKFSVFGARMFNYDSRYSSSFISGNRYTGSPTNGFITIGALYQDVFRGTHLSVQGWYYDFYHFAQLFYGEADVSQPISPNSAILAAVQIVSEGNSSGSGVYQFTAGNADSVNAHVYGGKLGMSFGNDTIALVGDYSPVSYGSYRHGGLVHPYNDLTGTVFTDTMQTGISDLGPGYAYGITSKFGFLHNKLGLSANYIRYVARYGYGGSTYSYNGPYGFPVGTAIPNEKLWAVQVGGSYDLSSILKGLYVEDDTDIEVAENRGSVGPYSNPYFSNRFYFKYRF